MQGSSLNNHLNVFFSREVVGKAGEDIVEKQSAEQGLMPVVADEAGEYGYTDENRHMVNRFLEKKKPELTFDDGLEVTKLLMACYMSAERNERLAWPVAGLDDYIPSVARETYTAKDVFRGKT
jgi:predicted dehydrogenase